ncbi:hypothetical protein CEXT_520611 [Caerostris extrusa]|uniref:Uncharacterized protein n=1 Tax=Caerostris extrusa TaxID=172846 RepID=A0AAV4M7I8_CAEEX|nr:hypothetical protein CEXT_520611 [Caerostris extrusa]
MMIMIMGRMRMKVKASDYDLASIHLEPLLGESCCEIFPPLLNGGGKRGGGTDFRLATFPLRKLLRYRAEMTCR